MIGVNKSYCQVFMYKGWTTLEVVPIYLFILLLIKKKTPTLMIVKGTLMIIKGNIIVKKSM